MCSLFDISDIEYVYCRDSSAKLIPSGDPIFRLNCLRVGAFLVYQASYLPDTRISCFKEKAGGLF